MREKQLIYCFLLLGGCIVLVNYIVAALLEDGSWTEWAVGNVFHVVGGGYAVFFVLALFRHATTRQSVVLPLWMEIMVFIAGALALGVFWEWYELAIDRYSVWVLGAPSVMTYADNIGDFVFDFVGAAAAGIYVYARRARARV